MAYSDYWSALTGSLQNYGLGPNITGSLDPMIKTIEDPNTYISTANAILPIVNLQLKASGYDQDTRQVVSSAVRVPTTISYMARKNYSTAYTWKGDSPENKTWFNKSGTIEYSKYPKSGFKKSKYPNRKGYYNYFRKVSTVAPLDTTIYSPTDALFAHENVTQNNYQTLNIPTITAFTPPLSSPIPTPVAESIAMASSIIVNNPLSKVAPITPSGYGIDVSTALAPLTNLINASAMYSQSIEAEPQTPVVSVAPVTPVTLSGSLNVGGQQMRPNLVEWYNANVKLIGESFDDTFGDIGVGTSDWYMRGIYTVNGYQRKWTASGFSYTPLTMAAVA